MKGDYRARAIAPRDRAAIHRVLRETLMLGRPLPQPVMDLDLLLAYFTDFYLTHEPEAGLVVVDRADRVVGYLLGTTQPARQQRWQRREAARMLRRWTYRWPQYDAFTRRLYRLRLRDAWETVVHPAPPVPAFLHWHLLPEVRGHWGQVFLRHFHSHVVSRGLHRFGGDFPLLDPRHERVFLRGGGKVVHRVPHHTLTQLMGQPVTRVTLDIGTDDFHT